MCATCALCKERAVLSREMTAFASDDVMGLLVKHRVEWSTHMCWLHHVLAAPCAVLLLFLLHYEGTNFAS